MKPTIRIAIAIALGSLSTGIAVAQTSSTSSVSRESATEIDRLAKSVTDALIAGDSKRAVDAFVAGSPLMAGKTIELGALQSQVQTAITAYGKVGSVELVKQQTLGTSMVRRYYVARQEKLVTRWELVFAQTSSGWIIAYFGFDDQQRTWFD